MDSSRSQKLNLIVLCDIFQHGCAKSVHFDSMIPKKEAILSSDMNVQSECLEM